VLKRNRSGQDSGELEFSVACGEISRLSHKDKDALRRLAVRLCESVDKACR
jgi:hypothetical protein